LNFLGRNGLYNANQTFQQQAKVIYVQKKSKQVQKKCAFIAITRCNLETLFVGTSKTAFLSECILKDIITKREPIKIILSTDLRHDPKKKYFANIFDDDNRDSKIQLTNATFWREGIKLYFSQKEKEKLSP
jgi:hypothetical protein